MFICCIKLIKTIIEIYQYLEGGRGGVTNLLLYRFNMNLSINEPKLLYFMII